MKTFQKLALVAAISAAPFAQAELVSISEEAMGDMTGQAGISIELDTAVTIASLAYGDTDGSTAGSSAQGDITVTGIAFGGGTVGGASGVADDARFDNIKIDIDVDDTAGVVIHLAAVDIQGALDGSNTADFGLSVASVTSSAAVGDVTIASGINLAGTLGPVDVNINNTGTGDFISVKAFFEVTTGSLDVDVIGLGVTNLVIDQDSNPFASDATYGSTGGLNLDLVGTGDDNWAMVALSVGTTSTTLTDPAGVDTVVDNALSVTIAALDLDISADLTMGDIAGTALNLGSIAIQDLNMAPGGVPTVLTIYGH